MKVRNAMCIFALFSIMALFFCFGVVANAAESGETETFTYSLSYEVPSNYTSNFIGSQFWNYGSFSLNYRLVILHHSDADVDVITSPDPDKVVVVSKNYNFYRLGNDGSLTSISSSGVSVSYTLRRVRRSNNEAETVSGNSKLQSFYASSISTDIPIYEADEAGKAAALDYLKTGNLPNTIPDIEDDVHYDDAYYFIDFKATDFVNASWSGMGNTTKIRDDGHTIINHYIAVKYIYGYRGMSVDRHTLEPFENIGNALDIDFTQYKPTVSEQYISAVLYTPYYKSGDSYFYGRTVSVVLSPTGKVQKVVNKKSSGDYEQVLPPLDGMATYDDGFKLIDFNTDKTGYSTWNGCTEKKYDPFDYTKNTAYVSVCLGYAYKTAPGQIALKYDTDVGFLISENKGSLPMSALKPEIVLKGMKNNNGIEYDTSKIFLRYISYTPCYNYGGYVYYGKSNDIYFKLDGSTDVTYKDREPTNGDQNGGGGINIGDLTNIKPSEIFGYFTNLIQTLVNSVQNVAPFINNIFGFLPSELRTCVYATFGVICACAVIRAIVGIFIH